MFISIFSHPKIPHTQFTYQPIFFLINFYTSENALRHFPFSAHKKNLFIFSNIKFSLYFIFFLNKFSLYFFENFIFTKIHISISKFFNIHIFNFTNNQNFILSNAHNHQFKFSPFIILFSFHHSVFYFQIIILFYVLIPSEYQRLVSV